jgi:hypothetical protein
VIHSFNRECIPDEQLSFLIPVKGNNIPELIQIVLEFNYCTHKSFETSFLDHSLFLSSGQGLSIPLSEGFFAVWGFRKKVSASKRNRFRSQISFSGGFPVEESGLLIYTN